MATLLQRLREKNKADKLQAELRLERRRGYDRAARERRARARAIAESGLNDLPPEIAVGEQTLEKPEPATEPVKPCDATVENLVERLNAIKERIFRLSAVFAVTLSHDCAMEANRYLVLFQDLAEQLEAKDAGALSRIVTGHEAILSSPPFPVRPTIDLDTQRLVELRWEVMRSPVPHAPERNTDIIHDGLGWML